MTERLIKMILELPYYRPASEEGSPRITETAEHFQEYEKATDTVARNAKMSVALFCFQKLRLRLPCA